MLKMYFENIAEIIKTYHDGVDSILAPSGEMQDEQGCKTGFKYVF